MLVVVWPPIFTRIPQIYAKSDIVRRLYGCISLQFTWKESCVAYRVVDSRAVTESKSEIVLEHRFGNGNLSAVTWE
jgi:hypothetical protein